MPKHAKPPTAPAPIANTRGETPHHPECGCFDCTPEDRRDPEAAAWFARGERVRSHATATVHVEEGVHHMERALENMTRAVPAPHPILDELRETILLGKRILARSAEIARRLPTRPGTPRRAASRSRPRAG